MSKGQVSRNQLVRVFVRGPCTDELYGDGKFQALRAPRE